MRVPFWLIPLDLLIAAPLLGTTSPETFTQMAAVAANGGLLPWQAGIATSFGRFQFVLGHPEFQSRDPALRQHRLSYQRVRDLPTERPGAQPSECLAGWAQGRLPLAPLLVAPTDVVGDLPHDSNSCWATYAQGYVHNLWTSRVIRRLI